MVITSGNVSMYSANSYKRNTSGTTTTTRWQTANPESAINSTQNFSFGLQQESVYNNYNAFAQKFMNAGTDAIQQDKTASLQQYEEAVSKTFRSLLELLYRARGLSSPVVDTSLPDTEMNSDFIVWNQATETTYFYSEAETTAFSSTGTAITADGRKLEFDVSFTMSRSFMVEYKESAFTQYSQVLTDPLVIQLDSNPLSLSDQTFFFDIDCDGHKDEISNLGYGNGFLAYDKNNDGIINDGSELFGPQSGNGFYDLSQYDFDSNGWIDEADDIYSHLKVWTKDENGNDRLLSLKEADVGAIYLGSSTTEFSFTNKNNALNGLLRQSGIFLKESTGAAQIIAQIDLAKHQED